MMRKCELSWELRPEDREFFDKELRDFVPDKVYDMHAHLWRISDWEGNPPAIVKVAPPEITLAYYNEFISWILPGREVHGMFFPFPAKRANQTEPLNEWVSGQITQDPLARGQFYVRSTDDPDMVRDEMKRLRLTGFKPFACFSERPDIDNAEINEFMPEWIPRLAHEEGWTITLHMQRSKSLADPSNQHWINTYCKKYPNMTLILDHCARGFNPYHLMEGLPKIENLQNLYVDTSVICNPLAVWACIEHFGIDHMLYASDFFCSHLRGTNLPVGDSFLWLGEELDIWEDVAYTKHPVLVGLENLRVIMAVFHLMKITDNGIESFFWNNAKKILCI